jgi:hypothetical protein
VRLEGLAEWITTKLRDAPRSCRGFGQTETFIELRIITCIVPETEGTAHIVRLNYLNGRCKWCIVMCAFSDSCSCLCISGVWSAALLEWPTRLALKVKLVGH